MNRSLHLDLLAGRVRLALGVLLVASSLASISGCLRQSAMQAAASPAKKTVAQKKDYDGPITPTDRPSAVFTLDGKPYCFQGTNNYYLTFQPKPMVDDVLRASKAMGLNVMRFWGYIDRGSIDGSVPSVDGDGTKNKVYFQYWDPVGKKPMYNDGPDGLERLDYVLDEAKKRDLKLIVVLTNNWRDFGGMDQYLTWYGVKKHYQFYTEPQIRSAFKGWIAHLINRKNTVNGTLYRDDPTIMAWELGNEPRCTNGRDFDSPGWDSNTIATWADEMSKYIKSMDPNHLVAVGDEGFFKADSVPDGSGYGYNGDEGGNYNALLAVKGIDFGTFHLYPDTWGSRWSWGNQWIEDHVAMAQAAGKPTILEEYGTIVKRDDNRKAIDATKRIKSYTRWNDIGLLRGLNGSMFWMLAGIDDVHGKYPDYDHFVVVEGDESAGLLANYAAKFQTEARACTMFQQAAAPGAIVPSKFMGVAPPPGKKNVAAWSIGRPATRVAETLSSSGGQG